MRKSATKNLAALPTRQQKLKFDCACYRQKALLSRSPKDLKIYAQEVDSDWSVLSEDNENNRGQKISSREG